MCSYAVEVPVADSKFFPVFCLGLGLSSVSPRSKSKLHLKHRSERACSDTTKTTHSVWKYLLEGAHLF